MFHHRFDGKEPDKRLLQVRLITDEEYCNVEFRDTPNNNILSTLSFKFSFSISDRQVSHLFILLSEVNWKNWVFFVVPLPCSFTTGLIGALIVIFSNNSQDMRGEGKRKRTLGETLLLTIFLPQRHRQLTTSQKVLKLLAVTFIFKIISREYAV